MQEMFGVERLYELYRSGSITDRGQNSPLLQVAKAIGPDLSLEDFAWLATQVEDLHEATPTVKAYQEHLWDLPAQFAARKASGVHFKPTRSKSGVPVGNMPLAGAPVPNLKDAMAAVANREQEEEQQAPAPSESVVENDYAGPTVQKPVGSRALDKMQVFLDVMGTLDPTPVSDCINAIGSLGRAITEPSRTSSHLQNALISSVSIVPVVGDLAKLLKYTGGNSPTTSSGGGGAANWLGMLSQFAGAGGGPPGGTPPISGAAGAAGAGGGGSFAVVGGLAKYLGPVALAATAVVVAFKDIQERLRAFSSLAQPPKFTGNAWDDVSESAKRVKNSFDAFAPFAVKWSTFGFVLSFATKQLQSWVEWFKKVDETSNAMLEHNRKISQYSGQMSMAFTQLDAARVRLDIGRADKMAGVVGGLARSQTEFEKARDDLITPFSMAMVDVQAKLTSLATLALKIADRFETVTEILEWWYGTRNDGKQGRSAIEESIRIHNAAMKLDKLQPFQRNNP